MEFFNKVRKELKIKNILWSVAFLLFSGLLATIMVYDIVTVISGDGIGSISAVRWVVFAIIVLLLALFILSGVLTLISAVKDTEYNEMLRSAKAIGDPEELGRLLGSMSKCKYVKGADLRFNSQVIFYMKGTEAALLSSEGIGRITTERSSSRSRAEDSVCIYHEDRSLRIKTGTANMPLLLKEMKQVFGIKY